MPLSAPRTAPANHIIAIGTPCGRRAAGEMDVGDVADGRKRRSATGDLFTYGTLAFPQILEIVLGRLPVSSVARLPGWRVAALAGRPFPTLVPAASTAPGLLLHGLTAADWDVIDAYEGPAYDVVEVRLDDGRPALTYVSDPERVVDRTSWTALPHDWDPDRFAEEVLASYVERCAAWRAGYDATR
jgi:hypothetical protein